MKKIEDIDIIFIWRIFKKHWHWISLTAAVSAISTYLICVFLISPVYKAEISLFAWDEKNKKPAFLQGSNPRPVAESPANDANYGISIHDINLGTQLVNDYKELINSRYVLDKVTSILEQKLPADKNVDFTFVAMLPRQTRFMRVAVYSKSSVKAELAAAVIAEVFIDSVNELMNIKRVQVVDKAKIIGIVSPKTKVTTIKAFVIGGGVMFLIFLAYAFFHHTLHDSGVVTSELKLPTIGKISEISGDGNEKLACLPDQNQQYRFNYAVEDFLLLQTNLFYSLVQKNSAQILLLTSATAKEGKTFVSVNLGLTLAGSGKKVLMINCDLRKIEFDYFDIPRFPGLVNHLLGETALSGIIHKNVLDTTLSIINSGPIPPNPTRMLEIFQNSNILEELKTQYDYIILDAPPLQNMADGLMLSKLADGTIIVADSKRTPVNLVRSAVEQLNKINTNILGVVLNHFAPEGYGYGYGYGYGQGEPDQKS